MTSATSSSSSTDRSSPEPGAVPNAAMIKVEPIEEDIEDEEDSTYSIDVSPEEVAAVPIKLEEMFNCPSNENASED